MGAFIIAGLVFVGTVILTALILFGSMMSDSPSASDAAGKTALSTFIGGCIIAVVIFGSHWMPHIGW